MENLANVYLHMAFVGTILILSVLAMRPIIKKFSNRMVCCLWAVVLFRLLCPITSGIGLIPFPEFAKAKDAIANETYTEDMHPEDLNAENVRSEDVYAKNLDAKNPGGKDLLAKDLYMKDLSAKNLIAKSSQRVSRDDIRISDYEKSDLKLETDKTYDEQTVSEQTMIKQALTETSMNKMPVVEKIVAEEAVALEAEVEQVVTKPLVVEEEKSLTEPVLSVDTMIEKAPVSQKTIDPTPIIFGIWMGGALLVLAAGIRKYIQLNKGLREAIPYGTHGKYKVKKCSIPEAPMSFGILRPIIYVPLSFGENSVDDPVLERQQKMILTHEQMHLKHHDPLWKALTFVALAIYWWNPIVWIYARCLNKDLEMACDEKVLEYMGKECKKVYATTLLDFATRQSGISLMAGFGESNAQKRIENILKYKEKPIWLSALLILCLISMGGCFVLADTADLGRDDTGNDKMDMTVSDGDALEPWNDATVSDGDGRKSGDNEINLMDPDRISSVSDGDALGEPVVTKDVKITQYENSKFLSADGTNVLLIENADQNLRILGTLQNSEAEVKTLQVGNKEYDLENAFHDTNYTLYSTFILDFFWNSYSIHQCNADEDEDPEYVIISDRTYGHYDLYVIDIDENDKAMAYNFSWEYAEVLGHDIGEYPAYSRYDRKIPNEYYVGEDNRIHFRFDYVNKYNHIEIMKCWTGSVRFKALGDGYCSFKVIFDDEQKVFTEDEKHILKEDVLCENPCDKVYKISKEVLKDVYLYGANKDEKYYTILRLGDHAYTMDFDWHRYEDIMIYSNDYDEDGCTEVALVCNERVLGRTGYELYIVEIKEDTTQIFKCPSVTIDQFADIRNRALKEDCTEPQEPTGINMFAANGTCLMYYFEIQRAQELRSVTYVGEIKYHEDGSFEYIERLDGDMFLTTYG